MLYILDYVRMTEQRGVIIIMGLFNHHDIILDYVRMTQQMGVIII
jgi:hypothetical protein